MRPVSTRGQGLAHQARIALQAATGCSIPCRMEEAIDPNPSGSLGVTREAMLGSWHPENTPAGTGAGRVMPRAQLPAHSCRLSTHSTIGSLPFVTEGSLRAGARGALETSGSNDAHFKWLG